MERPVLEILGRPNGAGKSTLAEILQGTRKNLNFINADVIARGLNSSNQLRVAIDAGRLIIKKVLENIERGNSFTFETTLAGRTWTSAIHKARKHGFETVIYYILVNSEELSVSRVARRIREGGHIVLEKDVRRRYHRSKQMVVSTYRALADCWYVFDNSGAEAVCLATKEFGALTIFDQSALEAIWEPEKFL